MHSTLTALAVAIGVAGLAWATDGLRAFTSEGARRLSIERSPRALPEVTLEDASGHTLSSRALLPGTPVVVGFVYTQCGSLCPRLTHDMAMLRDRIEAASERPSVRLLSVSFDPERDTPEQLARYAAPFSRDPERWLFARIADPGELDAWLKAFGITVISDGRGGFEHNAALHLVDGRGRLVAIHDVEDATGLLERIVQVTPR